MAALWADFPSGSQGIYGSDSGPMLDGIYAENNGCSLVDDPDPTVASGKVLLLPVVTGGGANYARLRYVMPAAHATAGCGLRWWMSAIPNSSDKRPWPIQWMDGSNVEIARLQVTPTGAIAFYNGGVLVATTSVPVLTANSFRHIEAKLVCGLSSDATIEVKVEDVTVLDSDDTGTFSTSSATVSQMQIGNDPSASSSGVACYAKDVKWWDGSGSENNDFTGPCGVYWRPAASDVSSGWARTSGATDYGLLDEAPPDDAGYIYADDSPPSPSIVGFDPLPDDIVSIRALFSVARMQKSDGGDGSAQVSLSPDGSNWDDGADNANSTAFTYYRDASQVSPATAAAWTPTEFSTLQMKMNRTV